MQEEKKHIIYVTHSLKKGNNQRHLINLINCSVHQGYIPLVISLFSTPTDNREYQHLGTKILHIDINKPWKLPAKLRIATDWIHQHNVGLIYGLMHQANLFSLLLKTISNPNIPLIWSLHDAPNPQTNKVLSQGLRYLTHLFSRQPSQIILFSRHSYHCYSEQGYPQERMSVIPGGVLIYRDNALCRSNYRQSVRRELALQPSTRLIGSLSRYSREKDIPCMLEAFSIACRNRDDICLLLAGEGMISGNKTLVKQIKHYRLEAKIRLLGYRSDAQRLIQALDIATLSARSATFPWFIAEAISMRIPCVATDVGDTALLLQRGDQLAPPGNPIKLASAWLQMLSLSGAERWSIINAAWQRVNEQFSLEQHYAQHASIYRKLCY